MKIDSSKIKILIELSAKNEGHKISYVRKCLRQKLGINDVKLSLIENGRRSVSTKELLILQKFFGLEAGFLVKKNLD